MGLLVGTSYIELAIGVAAQVATLVIPIKHCVPGGVRDARHAALNVAFDGQAPTARMRDSDGTDGQRVAIRVTDPRDAKPLVNRVNRTVRRGKRERSGVVSSSVISVEIDRAGN